MSFFSSTYLALSICNEPPSVDEIDGFIVNLARHGQNMRIFGDLS